MTAGPYRSHTHYTTHTHTHTNTHTKHTHERLTADQCLLLVQTCMYVCMYVCMYMLNNFETRMLYMCMCTHTHISLLTARVETFFFSKNVIPANFTEHASSKRRQSPKKEACVKKKHKKISLAEFSCIFSGGSML